MRYKSGCAMPNRASAEMERHNSNAKRSRRVLGVFHSLGMPERQDRNVMLSTGMPEAHRSSEAAVLAVLAILKTFV